MDMTPMPTPMTRARGVDQRIQDDVGHVREDGHPQDEAAQGQSQGHSVRPRQVHHGPCDDLDGPGVLEELGDDGAQNDDHADLPQGVAEALLEGLDEDGAPDSGHQAQQEKRDHEGQEDVPLPARRQEQEQDDDAEETDQRQDGIGDGLPGGVHGYVRLRGTG